MSMNIEEMRQQSSNNEYFVLLDEFKEKLQNELGKKFNDKLFETIVNKGLIVTVLESDFSYQTKRNSEIRIYRNRNRCKSNNIYSRNRANSNIIKKRIQ